MDEIQKIYIALFGRPADPLGLQYFADETNDGTDLTAIGDLAASEEYQSRFEGQSNAQVITQIYNSLFGRNPEAAGLTYFLAELNSGRQDINTIAINIAQGAQGDDLATLNNKVTAANAFTAAIDTPDELAGYQGDDAAEQGRLFLSGVTEDEASIPTAEETDAAVESAVDAGQQTTGDFTLTGGDDFADTNVAFRNGPLNPIEDDFRFSAGNERVTGSFATLEAGDFLADASNADEDVLNVTIAGNTLAGISAANVVNIENINLQFTSGAGTFNLGTYTGVQEIQLDGTLQATAGADVIQVVNFAGSGVTTIDASGIAAGANNVDFVVVADGAADQNITYTGGAASDNVILGDGDNAVTLGAGTNYATLGDGDNTVTGGALSDTIVVGTGDNTINAGDGVNAVITGGGDNEITTGSGADTITANGGSNTIVSGAGVDTIVVNGNGTNTITAGAGADLITLGSTGDDTVVFAAADTGLGAAADVITGFTTGSDVLQITGALTEATDTNYAELNLGNAAVADVQAAVNAYFNNPGNDDIYVYAYDDANGDGYLFVDADQNGAADYSVRLVGLDTAGEFARTDIDTIV